MNEKKPFSVWIGFDPREFAAYAVTRESVRANLMKPWPIRGLILQDLKDAGLYTRETERHFGRLYDRISGAYMSTEFAISRFFVPHLVRQKRKGNRGWALFMDCDMLVRSNLDRLFASIEHRREAVICVKHEYQPNTEEKMDDQAQQLYARKNWSSFMFFNCDHQSNDVLTPELINSLPGRDLHRFCWLKDNEIGELGPEWNWLVGYYDEYPEEPKNVHFTDGGPWFEAFRDVPFAQEWFSTLYKVAR